MTDQELYDMSDEELEAAFKAAKADAGSPDTTIEESSEDTQDEVDYDTEQPEEADSDDNSGEETEVEEAEAEEDSEEEETEEQPKTEEEPAKEEPQAAQKLKYKANGQEFEFTPDEVMQQFGKVFGQAMNYTQKMQAIAPYRGMIAALEEQKISPEDLNLAIDVLKGDKKAIAALMSRTGVDALELDVEQAKDYRPNNYGRDEAELDIRDVVSRISNDQEYPITYHVIDKQWDDASRQAFVKNPQLIEELHIDVKNGVFDQVSPRAMKMKVLDGGRRSDIEYYIEAGRQYYADKRAEAAREAQYAQTQAVKTQATVEKQKVAEVKAKEAERKETAEAAQKRKAAAPAKPRVKTVTNYLNDSDEEFEKWYKERIENH